MSNQGAMIDNTAPQADAPVIVFTMPSLRADDDVDTADRPGVDAKGSAFDAVVARTLAPVHAPADVESPVDVAPPDEAVSESEPIAAVPEPEPVAVVPEPEPVAAVPEPEPAAAVSRGGAFAPPTPDMRAEYIYSLVEEERERIMAARELHAGLIERLRRPRK